MSDPRDEPTEAAESSEEGASAEPTPSGQPSEPQASAEAEPAAKPAEGGEAKASGSPADVPAEPTAEDEAAAKERPRRVRRSRKLQPPAGSDDDEKREKKRPAQNQGADKRPRRERRPRRSKGAKSDKDDRGGSYEALGGESPDRTIFRQDTVAPVNEGSQPGRPPEKAPEPKPSDKDKITLILHPPPKAVPNRRKKKKGPKTAKEALRAKTSKQSKGDKKDKKKVELDPAWKTVGADGAVEALQQAGAGAEALVKAWLDAENNDAVIAAAQSDELKGKGRKAARRALGVLKSRGVSIPEPQPKAPPVTADEQPDAPVASFIPPDATGASFISISQRQPGGRYHVADAVLRAGVGVIQVTSGRIAGKQIRNWKNRVEEQFGAAPVEVPLAWARYRIAEARKQNDTSGQIVPLGFDTAADLFGPAPEQEPPHPVADLEEEATKDEVVSKAVLDSESLHVEPEFRSWLPDRGALDELLRKVGEKVGPDQADDPERVDKALEEELDAAIDRFFTPERRKEIRARMRDAAISVRERKGDDVAKKVLAVAKGVEDAGLITSPPNEIPFLKTFFQKAVALMLRQNQGQLRVPMRGNA